MIREDIVHAPFLSHLSNRLLKLIARLRTMIGAGERNASSHSEQVSGHTERASGLSCRNCHARLDYTDVSCPACGRKTTQFSLR